VFGGQQVGSVTFGTEWHAALWSGTPASFVDLHPSGATYSEGRAVCRGKQAGYAIFNGVEHAALWTSGTAASFVDLNAFLPPGLDGSRADGIWDDGVTTYVVGYGYNSLVGVHEALVWVGSACYANCDGVGGLTANDFQCFLANFVLSNPYADCDGAGGLTANDFQCFLDKFVAGCP
jgi:hypothetical protein